MGFQKLFSFFCLLSITNLVAFAQRPCSEAVSGNKAFKSGEELVYKISYNWGPFWVNAGSVTFTVDLVEYYGKKVYHFTGSGGTFPQYDWFYRVRDNYEAWADTSLLGSIHFKRQVEEGTQYTYNDYTFNHFRNKIYSFIRQNNGPLKRDSLHFQPCAMDVLTAIYYSRNMTFFNLASIGDTAQIPLVLDNKIFPVRLRYLGKSKYDTEKFGQFRCIRFMPQLLEGTIFKGGEGMVVWASDDGNHIPLLVETPIIVGSIKARLESHKNLRNKMDARIGD